MRLQYLLEAGGVKRFMRKPQVMSLRFIAHSYFYILEHAINFRICYKHPNVLIFHHSQIQLLPRGDISLFKRREVKQPKESFEFFLDIFPPLSYSNPVLIGEKLMTIEFTYTSARENLASLLDRVTKDRQVVIIQRRGGEDVAMISADELASLTETAYLMRSPQNAERILSALARALKNQGKPQAMENLRREVGLE